MTNRDEEAAAKGQSRAFLWLKDSEVLIWVIVVMAWVGISINVPFRDNRWWGASAAFLLILVVSCRILTHSWPLAWLLAKATFPAQNAQPSVLDELNEEIKKEALHPTDSGKRSESLAYIVGITDRSRHLSSSASSRATYHLFAGGAIGMIGITVFAVLLHIDLRQLQAQLSSIGTKTPATLPVTVSFLGILIQRLTVLIFIEVLAGFFLKQYRVALEDFRYYETITRRREAALIAFLVQKDFHDDKRLHDLAKELMNVLGFGVLKAGESTTILESAKVSENEFNFLVAQLANLVAQAKLSVEKLASANFINDKKAPLAIHNEVAG